MEIIWHSLTQKELFKKLKADNKGLTSEEATRRQKFFGFNELVQHQSTSSLIIFFRQFKSSLVYVLLAAAVLAGIMNDWLDVIIIVLVILINALFGWIQENKANQALIKIKQLEVFHARVLRDGRQIEIEAKELVPGDIIFIRAGDKIPADGRILQSQNFQCSETVLTGEPTSQDKNPGVLPVGTNLGDRTNMVYSGMLVVAGWCRAIVCAIGNNTEVGKIGKLVTETQEEITPLQEQLSKLSKFLSLIIIVISLLVFVFGLYQGRELTQMILIAVALAVAAIPEGLLIAVTIILTVGMQKILKQKAIVRRLIAAETLGSVSVICTDKTGTLTEGKMQVYKLITAEKEYLLPYYFENDVIDKEHDLLYKISVICSDASIENPDEALEKLKILGDPTEKALLLGAIEAGHNPDFLREQYPRLEEIPFDSQLKFMATINKDKKKHHYHVFTKGAPEKIISFCNQIMVAGVKKKLNKNYQKELKNKIEKMTSLGLRLIACAYKTIPHFDKLEKELKDLIFVGFIALKDPLRTDAKEVLDRCRSAGIRVVMVTGDYQLTAKAIFSELGIRTDGHIIDGKELDNLTDEQLDRKLSKIDIFARVEPQHKLRIIKAWQRQGQVVAMTGDGVNDSPALKAADVGIALGSGSDIAKETADIILLEDDFKVIVEAIRQGRIIFDNIRKVVLFLLVGAFSEIILISGAIILNLPLPILAIQILWINLIDSGFPNIALAFEDEDGDVMSLPPRKRQEPILNKRMKLIIFGAGILTDIIILFLIYQFSHYYEINHLRTIIFATLALDTLIYVFSIKSLRRSILNINIFDNFYLLAAVAISFSLLLSAIMLPGFNLIFKTVIITPQEWLVVLLLSLIKLFFIEFFKKYPDRLKLIFTKTNVSN